jgi:hypothetical protein
VQTKLGKMATNYLNKEFDVAIQVDKIDLSFLGKVQLKNVYIENHHNDTLIYINNLATSVISYRNILKNKPQFGTISLNNFKLYIKTYKGEADDALTIFVDKFDDGKETAEPSGFLLTSSKLKLKNGYVEISDNNVENDVPTYFKSINGAAKQFKIEGPLVFANIRELSFIENRGINVTNLTADFTYTKSNMLFDNLVLETPNSGLNGRWEFQYNRDDFSDFLNKVTINAKIDKASVSLIDLKNFYNELGTDDVLHFSTAIKGTLNNLTLENLQLNSNQQAIINGTILFKNAFKSENGFSMQANLSNLTSNYNHLKLLLPNMLGKTLPSEFQKLGRFTISGSTYITQNEIDAKLFMQTELGKTNSNLLLKNIDNIDEASYKGEIEITDFELGKFLNNPLIGKFSIVGDVDGSGFTLEKMNTAVKGIISKYEYNNYAYNNITIDGLVKNKMFNGSMEVNDQNIKLNFNGLADFSTDLYTFNFNSIVDYCDLNTINLFKRDSISNIKGEIAINVKGNSIDDLEGVIDFRNSLYTNQKGDYFFKDFNITSAFEDSVRTITVNSSEIINGAVKGNFKFNEISKLTQNSIGSLFSNYKPFEVSGGQKLDFNFRIFNKIVEIFYPDVTLSANTFIRGSIDSDKNLFRLNVKSPKITAFKNIIDDLNLQVDNRNPLFNTQLSVNKINTKYYDISKLRLVNITLNDTLYFRTEFKGGENLSENFNLSFYHTYNKENKMVFGLQESNFTFKNNTWVINPENNLENKFEYTQANNSYVFHPFLIESKSQKIEFFGQMNDTISKDLHFNFKNVELASITPKIDSLRLSGLLNGNLNYNQFNKELKPTVNLEVSKFTINGSEQGDLMVNIAGENSVKKYTLDIDLQSKNTDRFAVTGGVDFNPKQPLIDVNVDFEGFKLDAFSPLGEDVFTNIRGLAYGNVKVTGLLENPDMEGELFLDNAGMFFPYLNVDYNFEGTSVISLNKQSFVFEDVTLKDQFANTRGKLTGSLKHSKFDNWMLDLNITTKNLLVLNTEETETALYYGKGFLEGNALIKGPTDKLVIDVNGKTKKGTHLVIPVSDVKTVEESKLILFVNTDNVEDEAEIRRQFISEKLKGLSLNFNIEVTKEAIVEMVLDKATGSYLKGSGTGNLQIELDTKDKFEMYGDFVVDNGIYNFKYGGFINKPFTVQKGGTISWSGDPLTADIDIEAVYRVSANPKSLLENIVSNRKIPIDLITRFSGELFNSQRDFDIEIPNSSSTVASELEFKLNNNDKNAKTVHFISLLVSGSFYNENDLSVNSNAALYGTGFDMLSNAFDNIFNQGNNKFKLKPVYTVGERNKIDNVNIDDQLAIALDYQVNDRIIINGKVGMPIGSREQTSVIGEVNVEFLMNEEGTLRSSIFNRQNEIQYTEEEEGYTQGIGLSYQIDFDNGKELLQKLGLKKRTPVDSLATEKPNDTINLKKNLINFKTQKSLKND